MIDSQLASNPSNQHVKTLFGIRKGFKQIYQSRPRSTLNHCKWRVVSQHGNVEMSSDSRLTIVLLPSLRTTTHSIEAYNIPPLSRHPVLLRGILVRICITAFWQPSASSKAHKLSWHRDIFQNISDAIMDKTSSQAPCIFGIGKFWHNLQNRPKHVGRV